MTQILQYPYNGGVYTFKLSGSEIKQLEKLRDDAVNADPTKLGVGVPIYQYLLTLIKDSDGRRLPTIDPNVFAWISGAPGVNGNTTSAGAFIRFYTSAIYKIRYGADATPEQLNQASNAIAIGLATNILSNGGLLPDITGLGVVDAGYSASSIFNAIYSPWAGVLLFPFLDVSDYYAKWLLSMDVVKAGITVNGQPKSVSLKSISGTYDLIADLAAFQHTTDYHPLTSLFAAWGPKYGATGNPASLAAATEAFLLKVYGLTAGQVPGIGTGTPFDAPTGGPRYIAGTLNGSTVANPLKLDDYLTAPRPDVVNAGPGNDTILVLESDGLIDGGGGVNTADYSAWFDSARLHMKLQKLTGASFFYRFEVDAEPTFIAPAFTDYLYNIQTVIGNAAGDTLEISANPQSFWEGLGQHLRVDLGSSTSSQLLIDGSSSTSANTFTIAQGASSDDVIVGAVSGNGTATYGVDVTNARTIIVTAGDENSKLTIKGDITGTLGSTGHIKFVGGAGTATLDARQMTAAGNLELQAGKGRETVYLGYHTNLQIDNPVAFVGTIYGFGSDDTIDLAGIGTATNAKLSVNNILTISGGRSPVALHLDPGQNFSNASFITTSDGNGGTKVTFHLPPVTTVPGSETVPSGIPTSLRGISIADNDMLSASYTFSVSLSAGSGKLVAQSVDSGSVSGAGTNRLTLTGSLSAVNGELATLSYTGSAVAAGATATDVIDVATSDGHGAGDEHHINVAITSQSYSPPEYILAPNRTVKFSTVAGYKITSSGADIIDVGTIHVGPFPSTTNAYAIMTWRTPPSLLGLSLEYHADAGPVVSGAPAWFAQVTGEAAISSLQGAILAPGILYYYQRPYPLPNSLGDYLQLVFAPKGGNLSSYSFDFNNLGENSGTSYHYSSITGMPFSSYDLHFNRAGAIASATFVNAGGTAYFSYAGASVTAGSFEMYQAELGKIGGTFVVSDKASNVVARLSFLQAHTGGIASISFTDATTPTLSLTSAQYGWDVVNKIISLYNVAVSGVLASSAATVSAAAHVVSISVGDTAAQVQANFAALQKLASDGGKLASIVLTDSTEPTLALTAAQFMASAAALSRIVSPYNLEISGGGTVAMGANLTKATGVYLSPAPAGTTQSAYKFTANSNASFYVYDHGPTADTLVAGNVTGDTFDVFGTSGNKTLKILDLASSNPGKNYNNTLNAATSSGNNTLIVGDGSYDYLRVDFSTGKNTLTAGNGSHDWLNAESSKGNNTLTVGSGAFNTLDVSFSSGNNTLTALTGNHDYLNASSTTAVNTLTVGDGDANTLSVAFGTKNNKLTAGNGAGDYLNAESSKGANTLIAGNGSRDTLSVAFSSGNNTVTAGNGDGDFLNAENSSGNNTLTVGNGKGDVLSAAGAMGRNALIAGTSDTTLYGGKGYTTYKFGASFGQDTIHNDGNANGAGAAKKQGEVDFIAPSVTEESVWFERSGDDLVASRLGSTGRLTVAGEFSNRPGAAVQSFHAGGLTLDAGLANLVQAMATFQSSHPGFHVETATAMPTDAALQAVIAASWHH